MTTTQELIAQLRRISQWPQASQGHRNMISDGAAELQRLFLESQRDAEAIRQLREDNARLTACLANYHEAEADRIATAEQQEADEERDRARHRCGADVFSSPSSPS